MTNNKTIANLQNISLCMQAIKTAQDRPQHLPGIVCFFGHSGFGKSTAAGFLASELNAIYVEAKSTWTQKALLENILLMMGIDPAKTINKMMDQVAQELAISNRPLIVDEMDHLVHKKSVEIIRDIYESSGAPILLIGEERLPHKLMEWERFHGRILEWVQAQPAGTDDARELAALFASEITIADDLLGEVSRISSGSVRRICVNIDLIKRESRKLGKTEIDRSVWGNRPLHTGQPPKMRGR